MRTLAKVLTGLAALAFVLAVITPFTDTGRIMRVYPEGFSRACANLALLAIALVLAFEPTVWPGRSRERP